jgi:beta-galactosidase/beta-glucuronidase
MSALVALALAVAAPAASAAAPYYVHQHSAEHRREAAWQRTTCGSPSSNPPADIITQWGATVNPANVHPEYPRPQLTRGDASTWKNLDGLWEFNLAAGHQDAQMSGVFDDAVPFGKQLNQTILVPFPLEACLSGAFAWPLYSMFMFYRIVFDAPFAAGSTLLHFGAVDWNATVYVNGKQAGAPHFGGYSAFGFDITAMLAPMNNELIVAVYDPSDKGYQVNGKQRISAIAKPGGDTYTPSSGIWQTVWLENVPTAIHVSQLKVRADMRALFLTVMNAPLTTPGLVNGTVFSPSGAAVATFSGASFTEIVVPIPAPQLWHPDTPNLYTFSVTVTEPSTGVSDTVGSYFGMREVGKANFTTSSGASVLRPTINGDFTFLSGFLDQSWWSDGEYTAPTDDALKFDLQIVKDLGMNMIRLHQKVNPQRWYWYADTLGVVLLHDMVQKYGGATPQTVEPFMQELKDMIDGVGNHPCIIQWETFNEGDCVREFNATAVVEWTKSYDPYRLVDTNSGGPANNLHVGDVNDIHSYPYPGQPSPSETQVAMVGEFGGIGTYTTGQHEWANGQCHTYLHVDNATVYEQTYVKMISSIIAYKDAPGLSYCVYTQTTDVENECDGMVGMDRSPKFTADQIAAIKAANLNLTATQPRGA